jgi:alcohol dehydrogenase class IV
VAVGGGSPIDCAKCIGLLVMHAGPLEQYAMIRQGMARITSNKPPLIAVPTTAGTGSEVGRAALITMNSGAKLALISPHMIPSVAVCDPELTLDLPAQLTAATGMDAISHCVETFCSPRDNPVADAIAIDGLQRGVRWLRAAVERGHEIQPRHEMMMAALEGGLTFQKGLGMIHSLSHPLGSLREKRLHHGTLNAIFLPHVLRFNAPACPEKIRRMASVVELDDVDQLPDFFARLVRDVGLPTRLSALNVAASDLTAIAAAAMQDHSTPCNPRPMTEADCQQLLQAAL